MYFTICSIVVWCSAVNLIDHFIHFYNVWHCIFDFLSDLFNYGINVLHTKKNRFIVHLNQNTNSYKKKIANTRSEDEECNRVCPVL